MAESKLQLRQRLIKEGRWDAFNSERERLKSEGVPAAEAAQRAAAQFPPLSDGQLQNDQVGRQQAEERQQQQADAEREQARLLTELAVECAGREGDERELVRWVFQNVALPLEMLDRQEIPSPGALMLWAWVKASSTNYTEFIKSIWSKLLPSRAATEPGNGLQDNGLHLFPIFGSFDAEFAASGTEGDAGEPGLPADAAGEMPHGQGAA